MFPWMVHVLLIGLLLAAAARVLDESARLAGRPRRLIWALGLLATLVLAAAAPVREVAEPAAAAVPVIEVSDGAATAAHPAGGRLAIVAWAADVVRGARAIVEAPTQVAARLAVRLDGGGAGRAFVLLWAVSSGALLVLFAATFVRFRAARRAWPLRRVAGEQVRVAPSAGPAVFGLFRPEIVVPSWLLRSDAARQQLVIAHEREHVRGGDHALLAFGGLVLALLPWHPAVWWMVNRLRLAVELDCDARVLRRGAAPLQYGSLLVDIAGHRSGLPFGAAALADSPSHLERRLIAMTARRPRYAVMRGTALAAFASLLVIAACDSELPSGPEIEAMDVTDAQQRMEAVGLALAEAAARYELDGQPVSREAALALRPDEIASIEIVRGESGQAMRITSTQRAAQVAALAEAAGPGASTGTGAEGSDEPTLRMRSVESAAGEDAGGSAVDRTVQLRAQSMSLSDAGFGGVLLVNDERRTADTLSRLRPDDIESIEVIKGPAAQRLFADPAAANGVIRVILKPGVSRP